MGGASNRDSSVLPEHAVGPVESFINEFGRLDRGSPLRQLVGSVVAIARCHRLPESEPRVGCTPSAIHRQRREQGSGGGRRSDAIDSTEIIRPAGGSDRDKSEEPRARWTLESAAHAPVNLELILTPAGHLLLREAAAEIAGDLDRWTKKVVKAFASSEERGALRSCRHEAG